MNKQEALAKIKELEEYVENCDTDFPEIELGQLFEHDDGEVYIVTNPTGGTVGGGNFNLIEIVGRCGSNWSKDKGFGFSKGQFKYIGMAEDMVKIVK